MANADTGSKRALRIKDIDLSQKLRPRAYKVRLLELQTQLVMLQRRIVEEKHQVLFVFEGMDAAGKGGVIKRLTQFLDPRGFEVHPIGAPNSQEQGHHWLRRFWVRLPSRGRVAIFDRSWYGRMLVEPIEGFCTPEQYKAAAPAIREFEAQLASEGMRIAKFWLHVDAEEQLRRFQQRQTDPLKAWKLTQEDWRNREKFDQYVHYADKMFGSTDAPHAPWYLIAGNDKNYARVEVAQRVVETLQGLQ